MLLAEGFVVTEDAARNRALFALGEIAIDQADRGLGVGCVGHRLARADIVERRLVDREFEEHILPGVPGDDDVELLAPLNPGTSCKGGSAISAAPVRSAASRASGSGTTVMIRRCRRAAPCSPRAYRGSQQRVAFEHDPVAFVELTSFHGPEPIAPVVPKPAFPALDLQMIEEKLSPRKAGSATNGVARSKRTVSGSRTSTPVIGPHAALVTLGFRGSNARDGVFHVVGVERRAVGAFHAGVEMERVVQPVGRHRYDLARFGTGRPSALVASRVS